MQAGASSPGGADEKRPLPSPAPARSRRQSAARWSPRDRAARWLRLARRARGVQTGSCLGLGLGKCRAHALAELPFHLLGLGAQHRLAEAAELAGKRRVDLVTHLSRPVILGQPGQRTRGEPPDDSKRGALDLGFDLTRW